MQKLQESHKEKTSKLDVFSCKKEVFRLQYQSYKGIYYH